MTEETKIKIKRKGKLKQLWKEDNWEVIVFWEDGNWLSADSFYNTEHEPVIRMSSVSFNHTTYRERNTMLKAIEKCLNGECDYLHIYYTLMK